MSFPYNLYALAILGSVSLTAASLPLWRKWCVRFGLVDDPGQRKIHAERMPLAGGLAVATGLFLPLLGTAMVFMAGHDNDSAVARLSRFLFLGSEAVQALSYGFRERTTELAGIVAGAIGMLVLGVLDDRHELNPRAKFAGQLMIAALVTGCGVRITLFIPNAVFSYAITVFWILAVINAFNFMDNMNGLCAGLGTSGAFFFAVFAAIAGQYLVALFSCLVFGALLGFLPYNFPTAKSFLGDSGSHLVGYLMAILAILPHFHTPEEPKRWAVIIPLLVLAVPLLDMVWVVLLRWRMGKPFYVGDTNHLSHRLVHAGMTPKRAVALIWSVAFVSGALAVGFKFLL